MYMGVAQPRDRRAPIQVDHVYATGRLVQVIADGDDAAAKEQHAANDRIIRIQRVDTPIHEHQAAAAIVLSLCRRKPEACYPEAPQQRRVLFVKRHFYLRIITSAGPRQRIVD
jgi:hypothetical protein